MGVGGKTPSPDDTESLGAPNGDPNPLGRGDYDPDTGISEWYEEDPSQGSQGFTLTQLWAMRDLLEADLHSEYGIDADLADPDSSPALTGHSWRWLLVRIRGLLEQPDTRLSMALAPEPQPIPSPAQAPPQTPPQDFDLAQ